MFDSKTDVVGELEQILGELLVELSPTGSRVICNPPPQHTDEDWIVQVKSLSDCQPKLTRAMFRPDSEENYETEEEGFLSFRRGDLNLIVTDLENFYERFKAATFVAKTLNLTNKQDRIMLFQAVLYGAEYQPVALIADFEVNP